MTYLITHEDAFNLAVQKLTLMTDKNMADLLEILMYNQKALDRPNFVVVTQDEFDHNKRKEEPLPYLVNLG